MEQMFKILLGYLKRKLFRNHKSFIDFNKKNELRFNAVLKLHKCKHTGK